ncbi:MAG: AraC family transcriptional regulator [Bacteroidales bacterium]|nr:AraC family transcriptional regulator [Bacteroidales bacterium]
MLKLINRVLMAMFRRDSSPLKEDSEKSFAGVTFALHRWVEDRRYCAPDADMKAVAQELGISRDRLSNYCLRILGKSFLTWRKELRIAESQRLMRDNPDASLTVLAEKVGLDRANFRRQFNEVCGCSPQQWKEKHLCNK